MDGYQLLTSRPSVKCATKLRHSPLPRLRGAGERQRPVIQLPNPHSYPQTQRNSGGVIPSCSGVDSSGVAVGAGVGVFDDDGSVVTVSGAASDHPGTFFAVSRPLIVFLPWMDSHPITPIKSALDRFASVRYASVRFASVRFALIRIP